MNTMQRTLALFMVDAFYLTASPVTPPVYGKAYRERKRVTESKWKRVGRLWNSEVNAYQCFQLGTICNFILITVMAIGFSIPPNLGTIFHIICMLSGWLVYNPLKKTAQLLHKSMPAKPRENAPSENALRLSQPAPAEGDFLSRLSVLGLLILFLLMAAFIHPAFFMICGILSRWLFQWQVSILARFISLCHKDSGLHAWKNRNGPAYSS